MPPINVNLSNDSKAYADAKLKEIKTIVTPLVYILAGALILNGVLNYAAKK